MDGSPSGIEVHSLHRREIDDEAIVAERLARDVVAAAAHGDEEIVPPRELERVLDVGYSLAPDDEGRVLVDHRVEDRPGRIVPREPGSKQLTAQAALELRQDVGTERGRDGGM